MQVTGNSLQATIDRLLGKLSKDEAELAPGFRFDGQTSVVDDGGYGDPLADERPVFMQRDEAGWQHATTSND